MNNKIKILVLLVVFCFIYQEVIGRIILDDTRIVKQCSQCPKGQGVWRKCSRHKDTVCYRCIKGEEYSPKPTYYSPCIPCSRCGVGLYEAELCTSTKDTVCDSCTSFIGNPNFTKKNDFSKKCAYLFLD